VGGVASPGEVGGGDALQHIGKEGPQLPAAQAVQQPLLLHHRHAQLLQPLHHLHITNITSVLFETRQLVMGM
jgi:hypothetical protein